MVRRMDINTEQTIYRIAILFQRIAEESDARIDDQNIQRSVLTHEADDGITIGAIRLDGDASGFRCQFFGGFTRSGVAENDRCAVSAKASYNSRADTTTSPKTSTDLLRNSVIRMSFMIL